ncbi:glycosyltransferase family 2 protein [Carboxylicivirga sediminis]|uniref:Glycosyltransferase family 2 protein n=1 Tax=Carboxylicivirga sediminis TaxID=2006564 RepID=A0A941IWF3_9BACT|nr:glycosyltransferase family 2 protein [Carboxylicivirga sediminis]MBR8535741.1 glycosyltransferase family 2 protein [Carboxylicivirga sediminis]
MSTLSIITPLFNRLDLVPETWASIKAQTYTDWEWVVVDDGSTDGGDTYIKELSQTDPRVQLYYRKSLPKGPSRCRNLGVQMAKGDYLLFLDSDDIISPKCIEKRVDFIRQRPQLDFAVFTQATFEINIDSYKIFSKYCTNSNKYLESFLMDSPPWCISGPIWRKESFENTDGFREDYTIMEDPELHIRAILQGLHFEVVQGEPDFFYRLLPKTPEQELAFWHNSIIGRMKFYRDLLPKVPHIHHRQAFSKGILNLYKTFLLKRVKSYLTEHQSFLTWVEKEKLLSIVKIKLIKVYSKYSTLSILNSIPFLKGCLFRMI